MSNISNAYSDTIRFRLTATNVDSLVLLSEPIGWSDDDLELDRHKDYHGIFTKFTNNLEFINESKDYIERAYERGGINAKLILTKEILIEDGDDLIFKTRYTAIADFSTMVKMQNKVTIKFNSNDLAELLKSHESDDFEIETAEDIDGNELIPLVLDSTEIKGRSIIQSGESILDPLYTPNFFAYGGWYNFNFYYAGTKGTVETDIVSRGAERHSSVDSKIVGDEDTKASNMFYVDQTAVYDSALDGLNVGVQYDLEWELSGDANIDFERYKWNGSAWILQGTHPLGRYTSIDSFSSFQLKDFTSTFLDVGFDEGIMLVLNPITDTMFRFHKHTLIVSEKTQYDSSPNLDCIFNHDLNSRLLYIISGRNNAYYSKYFGRTDLLDSNGSQIYAEDGDGGLIGVMSGLWARAFDKSSVKYKSLTIAWKDLNNSNHAVFNTGIGIETVGLQERVREEDLKYFYQNEVAVRLPNQIKNVKRTVDKDLFFSGMTFGYDKAGDYEDSMGLDEPNTKTDYITPIRKSTKKYKKTSKVRTDEYGMELARRKPQLTYPDEDTRYDEGKWFLDLKRTDGLGYEQREGVSTPPDAEWDRLQALPTGIHSPETYRSMHFTPLRMLLRHAWVFRSGMEKYLSKYIKYISAVSNSQMETWGINDAQPYKENADIKVGDVDRSRFLPEIVEFEHAVSDELMEWINGTTELEYGGEVENIPNMYFKFEYQNENGILERGYLLNLKPNKEGKWKMQLSNENIIV